MAPPPACAETAAASPLPPVALQPTSSQPTLLEPASSQPTPLQLTARRARDQVVAPVLKHLGRVDYEPTWRAMQRFTDERTAQTRDEIWFLEHPPVFTLGMNANRAHVLSPGDIPVIQIDRGGQVTFHGPGQLVVYPLIELKRAALGVRDLVTALERSVIALAAQLGISAHCRRGAPGIYVDERKLGSVGIRVRRGASYHGLALNVNMDLEPFTRINPCGYQGLQMTQLADLGGPAGVTAVARLLEPHLLHALGFTA